MTTLSHLESVLKLLFIPGVVRYRRTENGRPEVTGDFTKESHFCNIVIPLVKKRTFKIHELSHFV